MKLVGTLTYNAIAFGGSSQVTLESSSVLDDAGRTTVYVRHMLTVRAVLYAASDTGSEFATIRDKLSQAGGHLVWDGQGTGRFDVNGTGSTQRDVTWGPKPKILSWAPIGSLRACEIVWQCEFCLPTSPYLTFPYTQLLAFNYGVSYSIDRRGCTTRTISGYLQIPLTRAIAPDGFIFHDVPNTADSYRSLVNPPIPEQFRRDKQQFNLSPDKSRLDFTIVDEEIPSDNPYPPGVVNIDARQTSQWTRTQRQGGFLRNRLTVSIELAFHVPMVNAYAIFLQIAKERISKSGGGTQSVIIEDLSCEEGLFDRSANFSVSWRFTYDISTLVQTAMLTNTGLFSSLTCAPTWVSWATSVASSTGPGGYQNMTTASTSDKIIDMLASATPIPLLNVISEVSPAVGTSETGLQNINLDSNKTWLGYEPWTEVCRQNSITRHSVLQAGPAVQAANIGDQNARPDFGATVGTADTFQASGNPKYWAIVRGSGKRAGANIPKPVYATVGTANTTEVSCRFIEKVCGVWLGVKIFQAAWEIVYALDQSPGVVANVQQLAESVKDT
jgi:hypothetical protein